MKIPARINQKSNPKSTKRRQRDPNALNNTSKMPKSAPRSAQVTNMSPTWPKPSAKIRRTRHPAQAWCFTPPPNPLPKGLAALHATPSDARSALSVIRRTALGAQACQTNTFYLQHELNAVLTCFRGGPARAKGSKILTDLQWSGTMLGPCWRYFSLLGASWPSFAGLAAFLTVLGQFLCVF